MNDVEVTTSELEPLPPGVDEEHPEENVFDDNNGEPTAAAVVETVEVEDPGTPLESEVREGVHPLENVALPAELNAANEDEVEDEEDEDEDDDIQITIGDIKSNVGTFRPPIPRGGDRGTAKPTSKLDLDAAATLNGASIFDTDLNSLEDKPWRKPGADITDFFNYGFTEETWQIYRDRQQKLREFNGSAALANKAFFSQVTFQSAGVQPTSISNYQSMSMHVPTIEKGRQIINLANLTNPPPQQIRTVPSMSASVPIIPIHPIQTIQPKTATVITPAVPTPAVPAPTEIPIITRSHVDSVSGYDSPPSSPGTPTNGVDEREEQNSGNVITVATPRSTAPTSSVTTQAPITITPEMNKIPTTHQQTAAPQLIPNLSLPPPRILPPTNLPPPGFGPPHVYSNVLPPTNVHVPPPGFGNPPPPGMPPHHFPPGPFGFPPPMRPQMHHPRFGPPPGTYGGFDHPPAASRTETHSPASYSDKSSDDDDRGDRYEARYPPGSGPASRVRSEHRRSRSPYSASNSNRHRYSRGHSMAASGSSRPHRSRSPVDRESEEKDRDRTRRRGDDEESSKKKKKRREDSSSDKKKSSKEGREESRSSTSKKRKRSKERKADDDKNRH